MPIFKIKRTKWFILASSGILILLGVWWHSMNQKQHELRIAFPHAWGKISPPPLQHSVYGAAIVENVYESLVRRSPNGVIVPECAQTWTINDNYTEFTFIIDTNKKFSDGKNLRAHDFKESWEHGLKLGKELNNKSLHDVLYLIEGYDDFSTTGKLSGVTVISEKELRIRFIKPFRIALDHLSGKRLAVYRNDNNTYIGTGAYTIISNNQNKIQLQPNKYNHVQNLWKQITISVIPQKEWPAAIKMGLIDVFYFANRRDLFTNSPYETMLSQEAMHAVALVNGTKDHLFENEYHRLALQYLIYDEFTKERHKEYFQNLFITFDPQSFMSFQPGRINDSKAKKIIMEGAKHVDALISASKETPILFAHSEGNSYIREGLQQRGLTFDTNFHIDKFKQLQKDLHHNFKSDLFLYAFSVVNGDPDGIHHALGEDGAIYSPILKRKSVQSLIEQGRGIFPKQEIHSHYGLVSEALLNEIPYVHFGFRHRTVAFNSDKVNIVNDLVVRNDFRFSMFEVK